MAWPMAEWVLQEHYGTAPPIQEWAVEVLGVPESRLIPLMRELGPRFPSLKLFSLPHLGDDACVRLGFRGRQGLAQAMDALRQHLIASGISFRDTESDSS
jgi:molybdopterin-biosynthesis enzyme MoeA-like protein